MDIRPIRRALISVFHKTGVVELAQTLAARGAEILSTGGTFRSLEEAGIRVTEVSDFTGFPECLDGRLKTLHPRIHGGLLFRRDLESHCAQAVQLGIVPIDLVVVNLYPFEAARDRPGATRDEIVEMIDIGGPGMIRAAAKNHDAVGVVTRPEQYERVRAEIEAHGGLSTATRRRLAAAAFQATARYDAAIAAYLDGEAGEGFPEELTLGLRRGARMRYGENPHQQAALYLASGQSGDFGPYRVLGGRALSYNNLLDAQAALALVRDLGERPAAAIIKHQTPCGAAVAESLVGAYERAFSGDPVSAFGGIVAVNAPLDVATLEAMIATRQFVEVVIAPRVDPAALAAVERAGGAWKGTRLVEVPVPCPPRLELRAVEGGVLVQTPDTGAAGAWRVVSKRVPDEAEMRDLRFAEVLAKHVRSNAIVLVRDQTLLGAGGGQTSRVDAVELAVKKAGARARGAVLGSDAFFPFPDGLEAAGGAGVTAAVEPGGSRRDEEVVAAADRLGMALVFTGVRHFRH
ncbi:MAG: bifunctional phosphoribosylaminoimidazolecarboxamide formyltransferase/IMP cyclohydrolase [Planctomycetes bacterium]|nr:bifunctional phosphoribosylaminoimidazolecarboxamide formyltransferase/IMP cyclohydrolase [Planctomycetota bacterium]